MNGRYTRRTIGLLLAALVILIAPAATVAQDDLPPRTGQREAPAREPVVRPAGEDATLVEVALAPDADTYIASARPTQNFGDSALFLGYNDIGEQFGAERIFLRFPVEAALPEGATIQEAVLYLYLNTAIPADDATMPTRLQRVDAPWGEDTLTWNMEPEWGPVIATETIGTETVDNAPIGSAQGRYSWEITELVRAWVSDTQTNYGVEIIGDEEVAQQERVFYARETTTPYYPRLIINYTDVSDTEPPIVTVNDLPEYVDRDFTVSWEVTDPGLAEIATYDVQVKVDDGDWVDWLTDVTATEAEYVGQHGSTYAFRARGVDEAGNVEAYGDAEAVTTVDTVPPHVDVDPLPSVINDTDFLVSWSGDDELSGIATYDVIFRVNGGDWTPWLTDVTVTSATYDVTADTFPEIDAIYEFQARGVDEVGNREGFDDTAEASIIVDTVAPFVEPRVWLPVVLNSVDVGP